MQQLQSKKTELLEKKATLEEAGINSSADQSALDLVIADLADIEEAIEEKMLEGETTNEPTKYTPAKGTEKMVHLKIVRGRRFDSRTGKEISKPYKQMFTHSEWLVFKKHHKPLGLEIVEVLYDPYSEAHNYVSKD